MKTCTKCQQQKHCDQFGPVARARDGLNWWCRDCMAEAARKSYHRHRERLSVAARDRQWERMQDPEVRERKRAADREAYRRNPTPYKEAAMRRRARVQAATVYEFTERDWRRIVERQRGECHYCGARTTLTKEHLVPLCRGGSHSVGNIVAACMDCNARKHTRTRSEFLVWLRSKAVA